MYKFLLCSRYLRTRWIALASIISVTLGVATMIVVNSVMAGFGYEMKDRIHGILSDIVFASHSIEGVPDAKRHMKEINEVAGEFIAGMSPTVHVPAMLSVKIGGQYMRKQINLIGIDSETYATVSEFGKYLQHPENREKLSFDLKHGDYDVYDHQADDPTATIPRSQMASAGWPYRRSRAKFTKRVETIPQEEMEASPFGNPTNVFNSMTDQHDGCVLGIGLCSYVLPTGKKGFLALPGDDVEITYVSAGTPPKPLSAKFTVVDFYESKMNEYDSSFVFVPIRRLQELRGMVVNNVANFNSIQIRLKPGADINHVRDLLREHFPAQLYSVESWRDKQGALLAAVQMETAVLNVLLFMIIAVAGFGILAIFFMIVVEKTRDIGILKSLGASSEGILSIFLTYGLSLGVLGSGAGLVLGLLFVWNINEIADLLGRITGTPVFDPSIYYFHKIPTLVNSFTVSWIVLGALVIAVLASVLPALRAARLHPVEALRHE